MAKQKMDGKGKRLITAWATTDDLDRSKDIINPDGVKFDLPLPLLFAHDHSKPIGKVVNMRKIAGGWVATAELLSKGSSTVADETWAGIVQDALNGVSVGFLPVSSSKNAQGGIDYHEIALHELSVVAIPCNKQAVIIGVSDDTPAAPSTPNPNGNPASASKRAELDAAKRKLLAEIRQDEKARSLGFISHEDRKRKLATLGIKPEGGGMTNWTQIGRDDAANVTCLTLDTERREAARLASMARW